MGERLATGFRPRTVNGFVGMEKQAARIMALAKNPPRAWLLQGEPGTGKTSLARVLALGYNCGSFGAPDVEAWKNPAAYGVREINASSCNGVDDIRAVIAEAQYGAPHPAKRRAYIFDEAHRMTDAAQNAFLKELEEGKAVYFFCSTNAGKLVKALRQRCFEVTMHLLAPESREKLVKKAAAALKFTGDVKVFLEQAEKLDIGTPRLLLVAFQNFVEGASAVEAFGFAEGGAGAEAFEFCRAYARGDKKFVRTALGSMLADEARTVRMVLCAYMRKVMLSSGKGSDLIMALTEPPPPEDPLFLAWFTQRIVATME